jgi:DNA-directed RNA polymerase subunit L
MSGSDGPVFDFSTMQSSFPPDDQESFEPTDVTADSRFDNYEVDFSFHDEGYTLVNILKQYLEQLDEVVFVGRRKHHPLGKSTNLRMVVDKAWADKNYSSVEEAIIDCLRRATRQAVKDTVQLRNSIPDIECRTVDFPETTPTPMNIEAASQTPFQSLFDPTDFAL